MRPPIVVLFASTLPVVGSSCHLLLFFVFAMRFAFLVAWSCFVRAMLFWSYGPIVPGSLLVLLLEFLSSVALREYLHRVERSLPGYLFDLHRR